MTDSLRVSKTLIWALCLSQGLVFRIFIPRFHFSHLLELYSPSGLNVLLVNLAVNKPSFVTPQVIGAMIAIYAVVLVVAIKHVLSRARREFSPSGDPERAT